MLAVWGLLALLAGPVPARWAAGRVSRRSRQAGAGTVEEAKELVAGWEAFTALGGLALSGAGVLCLCVAAVWP